MGHDITIIDIFNDEEIKSAYITGNFSKYDDKYPGIYAIHGHSNNTVIKIIRKTLNLLLDDGFFPVTHDKSPINLTYGDPTDPIKDLECYAACLQEFLYEAIKIKQSYLQNDKIYWYSDQVFPIKKFVDNGYESDGKYENSQDTS
jgi:hypothetical protein